MSIAEDFPDHEVKLLFEREELAADLASILSGDPSAADKLARLFDSLRQAMDSGLH